MMRVFIRNGSEHHEQWCGAFAEGLRVHGEHVELCNAAQYRPCDLAVVWGLNHPWLKQHKGRLLVLERGYVGDRSRWAAAGWNSINGWADFRYDKPLNGRAKDLGWEPKPWTTDSSGCVLIAGQVPGDNSVRHIDLVDAYQQIVDWLSVSCLREVRFRPHPLSSTKRWSFLGVECTQRSLADDLAESFVVVTINSNCAVDAVMEGVPAVTLDDGSVARDVTGHDLQDALIPLRPDRDRWLNRIAHSQWTVNEMSSGMTWEHLR